MDEPKKVDLNYNNTQNLENPENDKIFKCRLCNFYANFTYYGCRPLERHSKNSFENLSIYQAQQISRKNEIELFEKCFVCDDPFGENKSANFLILGSRCFNCKKMVCLRNKCSIFYYTKRFCLNCAKDNLDSFPKEIRLEIAKT